MQQQHLVTAERIARLAVRDLKGVDLRIVTPQDSRTAGWLPGYLGAASGGYGGEGEDGVLIVVDAESEHGAACVVLHELCHWLADARGQQSLKTEAMLSRVEVAAARGEVCKDTAPESCAGFIPPAFWTHGPQFIRAACHTWHRARPHHFLLPWEMTFARSYRSLEMMSDPNDYRIALQGELHELRMRPIREILRTPPPADFLELWHHDEAAVYAAAAAAAARDRERATL